MGLLLRFSALRRFATLAAMCASLVATAEPLLAQGAAAREPAPAIYSGVKKVQTWIPMKDGMRLAVNLYMPDGAPEPDEKFPAILEYLPYRKDDWSSGARLAADVLFTCGADTWARAWIFAAPARAKARSAGS